MRRELNTNGHCGGWEAIHPDDVALKLTLMPKSMRAGNRNKKTKTKRRMKVRAEKVLHDANQKHGAEVQEELDSLETVLHKSINKQPTLIGRVKMWLMSSPQEDPGKKLMRVAIKCQNLTAPADTIPPAASIQWPKLSTSCG